MCTCNIVLNKNCTLTQNRATTKPNNIALITKEHTHTCNRGHHIAIVHFNPKVYYIERPSEAIKIEQLHVPQQTHTHIEQHDIFTPACNRFLSFCPPPLLPLFLSTIVSLISSTKRICGAIQLQSIENNRTGLNT